MRRVVVLVDPHTRAVPGKTAECYYSIALQVLTLDSGSVTSVLTPGTSATRETFPFSSQARPTAPKAWAKLLGSKRQIGKR
jgi:hypothetical protein